MALDDPTQFEKALTSLREFTHWRAVGSVLTGLFILGLVLFVVDRCGTWRENSRIKKAQINVNLALGNLANAQNQLDQDRNALPVAVEDVKRNANAYVEAVNATTEARIATNRALQNLSNAVNNNRPVDVTANSLQKQLDELDK